MTISSSDSLTRRARRIAVVALALASFAVSSGAQAQTPADLASRRVLLEQAQKARDDGRHTEALDLAERAGAIKMTASVRRFIAEEQQSLGKLAEAFGSADQCIQEANQEASANAAAVRAGCIELRDGLKTKVGEVVLDVAKPPAQGLVVKVGGSIVNPALYGVAYVVTPGHVVIEATAPGFETFRKEIDIGAGAAERVTIELVASAKGADIPKPEPKPPKPEPPAVATHTVRNPTWLYVAGSGVVLVGVGATLGILSNSSYNDLKTRCTAPTPCDRTQATSDKSSIQTFDTFATIGIVGGAVLAAAGTTLYFALTREEPAIAPQVGLAPGGASVGVGGRF
jgi:hypothetical protein